ncbi:hypothetical protein [Chitinivorax sp. B]|uniref:hypothetical protein n=1 Tax=Chitinivorax sp. B TaxID=2502235 RepID=UPI0014851BFA|nr:hypothetical protein [Chitinivorax sp. B]
MAKHHASDTRPAGQVEQWQVLLTVPTEQAAIVRKTVFRQMGGCPITLCQSPKQHAGYQILTFIVPMHDVERLLAALSSLTDTTRASDTTTRSSWSIHPIASAQTG